MTLLYTYIDIDVLGKILLVSDGQCLIGLYFADKPHAPTPAVEWQEDATLELFLTVQAQLHEYMLGMRNDFTLPYRLDHGTPFQQKVWQALTQVLYGTTMSYQSLAASLGMPNGTRAIATAVARNPLSLLLPCHRIIGSNGSLTGYAGGLDRKKILLTLEHEKSSSR
jgi:methylated-DNA-[protein]-cysteine S-methyltransferase